MKQGYLSEYFDGVALKRLSAVEADVLKSHQHEFNGVEELQKILGEPSAGKQRFDAKFLYMTDQDDDPVVDAGFLTWYDARQKARLERQVMRWEYRLYFPTNLVSQCTAEGDLLVIAKTKNGSLLAIVAERNTTIERQIMWLFGFTDLHPGFSVKSEMETEQDRIGFATRVVLELIGIELEDEAPNYLEEMLEKFSAGFPKTADFSAYARNTIAGLSSQDDPDAALVAWMEREEILFRTLEKHLIGDRLRNMAKDGLADPEPFIRLVQSALQRRKSRAGAALENHLEQIFNDLGIRYSRTPVTENRLKPDFIFPSIEAYRDSAFDPSLLTMLAAKSTCKDRWRQIINEAARIPIKHLLTLEPSISENQTDEMKFERVQLILPRGLHETYTASQQKWIADVRDFTRLAMERQKSSPSTMLF